MPGLSHLDLNVADLDRSEEFYGALLERLGYRVFERGDGWVSWLAGDFYMTLVQIEDRFMERGFHRKGVGVNHLAFHAPSREAVDALHTWLVERGVAVLYGGPLDMGATGETIYAAFFEDPDRLKLEYVYRG